MAQYMITNQQEEIQFENRKSDIARTVQNAKNLLMTRMGEVPYDRLRGFDPALLALPIGRLEEVLMQELDRVMAWEPDVNVVSAEAELIQAVGTRDNDILITVIIDVDIPE